MRGPIVITGGGTGGHIFPMLAISEALETSGVATADLRFVGSRRGQEATLLGPGSVDLTLLSGRGLRRSFAPSALLANVGAIIGLVGAIVVALVKVGRWRPSVVVSVGGYASLAVSFAAYVWRRPLVLVELDATPGAAHRLFTRYAVRRCTAFATNAPRTIFTGAPLRASLAVLERSSESRRDACAVMTPPLDPSRAVVVVMTGSLGATRVNRAVSELAAKWFDRRDRAIVHVSGRRDFETVASRVPALEGLDYRVVDFADMALLWRLCDVAVCRSGATTVAELTALGIPSVLVPLPGAPGDHQTKNAKALVDHGAAVIIADPNCDAATLAAAIEEVLEPQTRRRMAEAAKSLGHRDAATRIAQVILDVRGSA
ncbi:MAG TPA: UDP-N-acetylglucosamine--N-acetylmuramyl-(pentapeptide) pyrophosphoryl-undecaprenol N-acetylglucosamine transferase [Acidimicrobiales bacterium]